MKTNQETTIKKLRNARRISVLTGAGISAESGVPTFRGTDGLWREFRAEELATPQAFHCQPKLVWEWYDWRRQLIARCEPNTGHQVLARWEERFDTFTLVTQNVDGLHRKAGSGNIQYLHGDIWLIRCTECGDERLDETVPLKPLPPTCQCGGLLRPGVVWFGESLPVEPMNLALDAARNSDVMLVVGTSGLVYPAAGIPAVARQSGAWVLELNIEPTALTDQMDHSIFGPSGHTLEQLEREVFNQ